MLRKKVEIDGREVEFKASAAVPRIYPDEIPQRSFHGFAEDSKVCEKERQKRG